MSKGHTSADRQESVGFPTNRRDRDAEPRGRAREQEGIADGLGRRQQKQQARVVGERLEPSQNVLPYPGRQGLRLHQAEAAGQLCRGQLAWQLEQCLWISACLLDDPVPDRLVQLEPQGRAQQCAGVSVTEAMHVQLGHVLKLVPRFPRSEHEPDRLGPQAMADERERLRGGLVKPLRVVDDTQQGTLGRHCGEEAQDGQPNQELSRRRAGAEAEHDL